MDLEDFRRNYEEKRLLIGEREWRYIATVGRRAEDAPVLLLLPGAFGAAEIFWNQLDALGETMPMVAITYPGGGTPEALAGDLFALMDHLRIGSASLLGSSLGGHLAQTAAAQRPERVETLFVANSLLANRDLAHPLDAAEVAAQDGAALRERTLATIRGWPEPDAAQARLKQTLAEHGRRRLSDALIKGRMEMLAGLEDPPRPPLPDARVVLIESADDPMISPGGRARLRERFPGAARHELPDGGHFPYVTRARAYTAILAERLLEAVG